MERFEHYRCTLSENFNGIKDSETGLIWGEFPEEGVYTFEQALALENSEWRLPTVHELFGIVDTNRFEPATLLPNHTSDAYWSGSPFAYVSDAAWYVYFNVGFAYYDSGCSGRRVRLVRR